MKANQATVAQDPFFEAIRGYFTSVLRWQQLDELWQVLRDQADAGWYIYAIGEAPPNTTSNAQELNNFISEIDKLLRKEHEEDYCGIVYTDSKTAPQLVKIYDPNNLGVVCGYSDNPPAPGWILSRIPPKPLENNVIIPGNRRRWWQRLWS